MKNQILNILPRWMLLLSILLGLLFMATVCDKETKDNIDVQIFSLDKVPVIVQYEELSLIGTDWKLIGFVNIAENTIKIAEPQNENCYKMIFKSDGTFSGQTSTNSISGKYEVNSQDKGLKFLSSGGTKINELFDGKLYVEIMLKVESFSITERGLALYYDNKKHFLLFKPVTL